MAKRKGLSNRTRFEVFKRDRFVCQYCGRCPPQVILQVDHVVPVSSGGTDDQLNLLTSCRDCNLGKSNRKLDECPVPIVEQMEIERERHEQIQAYNTFLLDRRAQDDEHLESLGIYWFNQFHKKKDELVFGDERARSIRTFLKHLPFAEILECIDIAFFRMPVRHGSDYDAKTFRYFCGVCWNKIRSKGGSGQDA